MESVEHQGVIAHRDEWRPGSTCEECLEAYEMRRLSLAHPLPGFKIGWLKESNKLGMTAREFRDEIYEEARAKGIDITRAR